MDHCKKKYLELREDSKATNSIHIKFDAGHFFLLLFFCFVLFCFFVLLLCASVSQAY